MMSYIYTAGATAIIAFSGGWTVKTWKTNSDHKKTMEAAVAAHNEAVSVMQAELEQRDREKFELSTRLDSALSNVRTEYRTIEKEIPRYVPQSTETCDCSLGPEFRIMFNRAARRDTGDTAASQVTPFNVSNALPGETPDLAGGYPQD